MILLLAGMALAHDDVAHDTRTTIEGCVVWAGCAEGTCLLELTDAHGETLLVRHHGALDASAGQGVRATGLFFRKIYPRYRMQPWQALGWHAGETLPDAALVVRMDAPEIEPLGACSSPPPEPVTAWAGPAFDLGEVELEAGGMGTGRKCLEPGGSTATHSTWGNQEFLFGLEGTVRVTIAGHEPFDLVAGGGARVPPQTEHGLENTGTERACYLFVYGPPNQGD